MSIYRFTPESIVVNVGDTVEWTNSDPVTAHTVTFGTEAFGSASASFRRRDGRFGRGEACGASFTNRQRALGVSRCGSPGQDRARASGSGRDAVPRDVHNSGYLRLHLRAS